MISRNQKKEMPFYSRDIEKPQRLLLHFRLLPSIGPRQSRKTTLAKHTFKKHVFKICLLPLIQQDPKGIFWNVDIMARGR